MARSKRNRVVALTKTKKTQLLDKKGQFVEKLRDLVEEYKYTYSFAFKNMTTLAMQSLRQYFRDDSNSSSIFLLGKSTVMQVALGRNEEEEYKTNMHHLSETLKGNTGLFFSNKSPEEVIKYFNEYACPYFPSPNSIAKETIILKKGQPKEFNKYPSSMESYFRTIGMKIKLDGGRYYLLEDFIVSQEGKPLKSEQVKAMRLLELRNDEFKIKILAYNTKEGEFKVVNETGFSSEFAQKDKMIELN